MLKMLSESAQFSADKQIHSQKEQVIAQLPRTLSQVRFEALTTKPIYKKVQEFVYSCYNTVTSVHEEESTEIKDEEMILKEGLSLEDLEFLLESFQSIGYFDVASGGLTEITGGVKCLVKNVFGDK